MRFGACYSKHNMSVQPLNIHIWASESTLKARGEAQFHGSKMKGIKNVIKTKLLKWMTVQSSEQ